jgi:4-hydroxybenzoate polyprenyltransferase
MTLKTSGEGKALSMFKANVPAGAIVAVGFLIAALFPADTSSRLFAEGAPAPAETSVPDTWLASDLQRALEAEAAARRDPAETRPDR